MPPIDPSHPQQPSVPTWSLPAPPPKPASKAKVWIALAVALVVLAAGATGYVVLRHRAARQAASQPNITLYYSDGKTVLWQGNSKGFVTKQQQQAPYFVGMVLDELTGGFGLYDQQGTWKVTTTLDKTLQAKAEQLVADNVPTLTKQTKGTADEEAIVLEDVKTGQLKALVGGTDWFNADHGQLNYAAKIPTQPGPSIEPFVYAAAIQNTTTLGAGSKLSDSQGPIGGPGGWPCTNRALPPATGGNCLVDYDFTYPGDLPLRYALGGARSVPAVEVEQIVGLQKVMDLLKLAGVSKGYNCYADAAHTSATQCYDAATLGDGAFLTLTDETHALATLANSGSAVPQTTIVSASLNGKVKLASRTPSGQQALKPDTAYIINNIMSDPNASYLPGSCTATTCTALSAGGYKFQRDNGWTFAVDSGNAGDGTSGIMASWSPDYAVVSWIGNHTSNRAITSVSGLEGLTIPLTRGLMEAAHAGKTPATWAKPADIQMLPGYVLTHHIHGGDVEPSPATDLYPAWYKQQ